MVKSKLALIIDSVFISSLIGLLGSVWLKRFIKNAYFFNFILILVTVSSFILILYFFLKSNNKKVFKSNNEKFLKNCLQYLILSNNKDYSKYLCQLLNCSHIEDFLYKKDNRFFYINLKNPLSSEHYFIAQELFLKYKNKDSSLHFIYNIKQKSFDDVYMFSSLHSTLFNSDIILELMHKKNLYPIPKQEIKNLKFNKKLAEVTKSKLANITKSHFKEFLFSGLSLLILSLIIPFSTYYLIVGTILLIISIISLFKKDFNPKGNNTDFFFE